MKRLFVPVLAFLTIFSFGNLANAADKGSNEKLVNGFIEALNSGSQDIRREFLKENYVNADSSAAIERWLGHFDFYHNSTGNLEPREFDFSDPLNPKAICHVEGKRTVSEWMEFTVIIDSTKTDLFRAMSLHHTFDPAIKIPKGPLSNEQIAALVKQYVERMVERDVFSGTVALAKDGEIFFSGAYGKADLRWNIPNNIDTKFNLGSMNKMFTSVAICQLAEQGKLSFDDYLIKHLPDHPNKEVAEKVKIHHLLTHTSGMGSYWRAMDTLDWTALRSVRDFADLTVNDSLEFEPGDHFSYSNSGPIFLGLVIEKITGMDYHDYIRKFVTGPAGMVNTDCYENDIPVENLAQGYFYSSPEEDFRRSNIFAHSARGGPAGGGFSTSLDLQRFANALLDKRLLSAAYVDTMTIAKADIGPDGGYAYLFGDYKENGHRYIGHSGGAPGINADLSIFPDIGYTVSAMTNYGMGAASSITEFARMLITHDRSL